VLGHLGSQVLSVPRTTIRIGNDVTTNYTLHGKIEEVISHMMKVLNMSGNASATSRNKTIHNNTARDNTTFSYTILKTEILKMHFYFAQGLASGTEYTFTLAKMGPWGSVGEGPFLLFLFQLPQVILFFLSPFTKAHQRYFLHQHQAALWQVENILVDGWLQRNKVRLQQAAGGGCALAITCESQMGPLRPCS
jgi:hypothetical protein